ncbi:MAG TPA: bi-domain-containing oxidoreductase, partial [Planctomycetaceae bacterium]|nr:bi-domain-containing oxidoreductase [Planctomycetaceae bacterium]
GYVVACGDGVQGFKPGDRVASNGPHAGLVCVPKHLCAAIPENVPFEHAAFTVIASIALQGIRLSRAALGETVLVIGLGLIGQIAVKLLQAQGCRVIGTDLDPAKCQLAMEMGADQALPRCGADEVHQLTRGIGADVVLITAATPSDAPVRLAADCVRHKGRVVAVGAVGLNLPRQPFYLKEAEFVVSCSYGAGRYDPEYEERGHDYPVGHVRWTEQRNMQSILDLMGSGRLDLSRLISHRFSIDKADRAYEMIQKGTEPYLGIVLSFGEKSDNASTPSIEWKPVRKDGKIGIGCLGAGGFARMVLIPTIRKSSKLHPRMLCSAGGLSATVGGQSLGFDAVTANEQELIRDPGVDVVFVITRHDQHARQVVECLRAGKHVFVEKPLALTVAELAEIEAALHDAPEPKPLLTVGFNRRFSPAAQTVKDYFAKIRSPLTCSIRFNAGMIPADHWTQDDRIGGGRIIGEACHAIDLATYLVGSPPVRVFAESIGGPRAPEITDDQCFITLRHANGSISSIGYLSAGDKSFPKERIEVIGGGRIGVIDDFRSVTLSSGGNVTTKKWAQDKGHRCEISTFAEALEAGQAPPISWAELRSVSLAAILAVRSLREGLPQDIPQTSAGASIDSIAA